MDNLIHKYETVLYEKCGCLYGGGLMSRDCYKRYFRIYNHFKDESVYLGVCNNQLRLEVDRIKHEPESRFARHLTSELHVDALSGIIEQTIFNVDIGKIFRPYWGSNANINELMNRTVVVNVCERPWLYHGMCMHQALEIIVENDVIRGVLANCVMRVVERYVDEMYYKKYKTKYSKVKTLIKKSRSYRYGRKEYQYPIWMDIFQELLELNTKGNF